MGTYPPRVQRDRGVPPRGNSRRARLDPSLAKGERGGRLGQWDWGSENAGMKVICLLYYMYIYTRSPSGVVNCSQGVMQEKCITMEKAFAR